MGRVAHAEDGVVAGEDPDSGGGLLLLSFGLVGGGLVLLFFQRLLHVGLHDLGDGVLHVLELGQRRLAHARAFVPGVGFLEEVLTATGVALQELLGDSLAGGGGLLFLLLRAQVHLQLLGHVPRGRVHRRGLELLDLDAGGEVHRVLGVLPGLGDGTGDKAHGLLHKHHRRKEAHEEVFAELGELLADGLRLAVHLGHGLLRLVHLLRHVGGALDAVVDVRAHPTLGKW